MLARDQHTCLDAYSLQTTESPGSQAFCMRTVHRISIGILILKQLAALRFKIRKLQSCQYLTTAYVLRGRLLSDLYYQINRGHTQHILIISCKHRGFEQFYSFFGITLSELASQFVSSMLLRMFVSRPRLLLIYFDGECNTPKSPHWQVNSFSLPFTNTLVI